MLEQVSPEASRSGVLVRGTLGHRLREDGHLGMQAEVAVRPPTAKERPGPPEAGRGTEGWSPNGFRRSGSLNPDTRI